MTQAKVNPHQWVEMYADYLYAYATSRIGDEELARDLVQETFLAGLESIGNFEGKSTERTWLIAVLKNKILDVYRKRAKLPKIESIEDLNCETQFFNPELNDWKKEHWPEPFGIEQGDPLETKEFQHILRNCMQKLPPLWFAVFSMKHIDGESTKTICEELEITDCNFWVIIHRSKVSLRSNLQKHWIL